MEFDDIPWWGYVTGVIAILLVAHFQFGFLSTVDPNERSMIINGVPIIYSAVWGHSQYACVIDKGDIRDVFIQDNSDNDSLSISGHAPNTGSRSCSTYSVGATASFTFDPKIDQRMVVNAYRSTECSANRPYADSSVSGIPGLHQELGGDGSVKVSGGKIIVWNSGGAINVETTEGRTVVSDINNPLIISMSTGGGNKNGGRMYGCDMSLRIDSIERTFVPNPPQQSSNFWFWVLGGLVIAIGGLIYYKKH